MTSENKQPAFSFLCLVAAPRLVERAIKLLEEAHVPIQYQSHAQGTASSEMMDMLGLGSVDKMVLISMMPKGFAGKMLMKLKRELHLGRTNSGIAFTISLTGSNAAIVKLIERLQPEGSDSLMERKRDSMKENEYRMIMAFVDQGCSEELMSAARSAGATGGTVFHSRRVGHEDTLRFWGVTIQAEREIVIILAPKEDKVPIMKAINEPCGVRSEAHGVVVSLPVDSVAGLNDYE